jgi:hypothetical protein
MASNSSDPIHFTHTDLDGDRVEVIEGELGAVVWAWAAGGDHVAIAVHYGADLQLLIDTLTAIQNNR